MATSIHKAWRTSANKTAMRGLSSLWLLPLLAAGAATGWWWHQSQQPQTAQWLTAPVQRGNIEATVAAVGTLQPLQSVEVGAQVSGQITRLLVKAGDVVEQGQPLAEIDASVLAATVEAGQAQIKSLQAELTEARANRLLTEQQYQRQESLVKSDATSKEAAQIAHTNLTAATARVEQIQAQIQQIKASLRADEARLGYTRIVAPIAGTVTSVDAKVGQTLNATYQTPTILRIADLSRMQVWTQVSEADIGRIRAGQNAWFTTMGGMGDANPRRWEGSVEQVLPAPPSKAGQEDAAVAAPKQAVQYTVLFDVGNDDGALMPQMTAQVVFVTEFAQDVLLAPLGGLTSQSQQNQRYSAKVLDAGQQIQEREVQTGKQDRMAAEVISGLQEGDLLITGEIPPAPRSGWLQW